MREDGSESRLDRFGEAGLREGENGGGDLRVAKVATLDEAEVHVLGIELQLRRQRFDVGAALELGERVFGFLLSLEHNLAHLALFGRPEALVLHLVV